MWVAHARVEQTDNDIKYVKRKSRGFFVEVHQGGLEGTGCRDTSLCRLGKGGTIVVHLFSEQSVSVGRVLFSYKSGARRTLTADLVCSTAGHHDLECIRGVLCSLLFVLEA